MKEYFAVGLEMFIAMCAATLALSGVIVLVTLCISIGLYLAGYDPSPSAAHHQAQIEQCHERLGTVVLDGAGYLKECWVGVPNR